MSSSSVHDSNPRIFFDSELKTFRLYPGNSLYAFSISPELSLEHLYWGKKLQPGFDLRYLSQSSRMTHFSVHTEITDVNVDKLISDLSSESIDSLADMWKRCKNSKVLDMKDAEAIQNLRAENLSWRMISKSTVNVAGEEEKESFKGLESFPINLSLEEESSSIPSSPSSSENLPPISLDSSIFDNPELFDASRTQFGATPRQSIPSPHFAGQSSSRASSPKAPRKFSFSSTKTSSRASPIESRKKAFDRSEGQMGKGSLNTEYSDHGTGDFRTPSFQVVDNFDGSSISPLQYRSHRIYPGKLPMPDLLPGLRLSESEASTLVVTMADLNSGLEVDLIYVVLHNYDAVTRRAVFKNRRSLFGLSPETIHTHTSKVIQKASAFTIDFESASTPFHLLQLSGSWGRERQVVETKLAHGIQCISSSKGVSGHQHNPFAALSIGYPSETSGETKGFSFVYSGNFLIEAELSEIGRLRLNIGINPMSLQWHLKVGTCFNTPECILVRSSEGLGGMSRELHRLMVDKLLAPTPQWAIEEPPVLLNTWEGNYFDVDHDKVVEIATQASRIGIDLIVLDDGWFGERNDITSSLGDWFPNPKKFPQGLKALADEVNAAGCRLGLWFEPEMVSERSQLHLKHPDWHLRVPGKPRSIGRHQMVLDLSRVEVRDYLFSAMSSILEHANIEYIKWDMNRPLTEVYSLKPFEEALQGASPEEAKGIWQSEISHRYMLGVYDLMGRIVQRFPHVLLENCASGGGRFDPGMLYYSPQIWCSDNTDAITRMKIQYGTSIAYPARCIGSHLSSAPNHITGNTTRARTRGFVAMCGTFGFELNLSECSGDELLLFKEQTKIYKSLSPIIFNGDLYRLWDPFKTPFAAWSYVSRDKSSAVVFAFSMNSDHWSNLAPRLMLQGLLPDSEYEVTEPLPNNVCQGHGNLKIIESPVPIYQLSYPVVTLTGDILMNAGLPIKFYTLDDSHLFLLTDVKKHDNK